ncbi:Type III effector HopV1 [Pseudomonas syringae pv. delphinii]|uniref:Type III effector HopV1 n=1 Tax=Pseudomonas syringae pv. delphinii TaxID=192088 RepID=A0A3M4KEV6_9PSED|nr:type III effector [Pseudomonas syringae group genomosp. 3]RMP27629.1 Type III effector HopV1 [Pseudomonas syringae pv. delphinii]RMQ27534.1 Type III effector HopV1 [Pseudomonas syringae pv. delphinii]
MLNKPTLNGIASTAQAAASHAVEGPISPAPMRLDAAQGQRPLPPMDAPSSLRLRASAAPTGEETHASTATSGSTATDEAAPAPARQASTINPIKLFAQMMVGVLSLTAGYRAARFPGDFAKDPGGSLWAAINLDHRSSPADLTQGNHTVLERYGAYIPKDSGCFKAKADVTHDIPSGVAGQWNFKTRQVKLNPNIALGRHPAEVAGHEFIHCYTHPEFRDRHINHPHWKALNEGLTTHLTEKLPEPKRLLPIALDKDPYHGFKLTTGDSWPDAAKRIEGAVGEDTLLKAFFGGDDDAISEVAKAAAQIYPRLASSRTEQELYRAGMMRGSQQLAECYAGALLASGQPLPESWSRNMLPVFSFSDMQPEQAKKAQLQAEQSHERMGIIFDAAFFSPDLKTQRQALGMLREDLLMHWENVVPDKG